MSEEHAREADGGVESTVERTDPRWNGHDPDVTDSDASEFSGEELIIGYPSTDEPVIDGESLRVPPGEVTALVGPNGSAKSTLLKGLANQLGLNAGTVLLDGKDIHTLETRELARKLGLLSQENTSPNSIAVENLVEHANLWGVQTGEIESLPEDVLAPATERPANRRT
jgi:iron complex transport system ATP-binding protein